MHLLIAIVLLFGIYATRGELVERPGAEVGVVESGGPAQAAGIESGDVVVSIGGDAIDDPDELGETVRSHEPGDSVAIVVERDGEQQTVTAVLGANTEQGSELFGSARLGVSSRTAAEWEEMSVGDAAASSVTDLIPVTWESTKGIVQVLNPVNIVNHLSGESEDLSTRPTTVVGVTQVSGTVGETEGLVGVLYLLAVLNVFVGVFNMFPLLPLDGGHAAVATYERLRERGRPALLRRRVEADAVRDGRDHGAARPVRLRPLPRHHPTASMNTGSLGERRPTRQIHVGSVAVGGGAPVSVQSMTITKTADVEGTLQQIYGLAAAGCDIVRCTCNEAEAAEGLAQIVPRSPVPIIADIHHQYRMALAALEAGVHGSAAQPGQHPPARAHQGGGVRGPRPAGADPHRRQRRLARPGAVRALRRRHAGGDGRLGDAGDGVLRRGRLRPRQDLGQGVERAADGRGLPAALGGDGPPVAPRRHRGRAAAGRSGQGDGRDRDAAARRASATRSATRSRPIRSRRRGPAGSCSSRSACASARTST